MKSSLRLLAALIVVLSAAAGANPPSAQTETAGTPKELVTAYGSLADTILAAKKTEWNLVRSILATTYGHAQATLAEASAKMKGGQSAKAEIEKLAGLVSQLGNEGDASVAAVRKRLVEGGHHHHAEGEKQGEYDQGFVVVTKVAKKAFLDSAGAIGKMAAAPDAKALDAEWQKVKSQYAALGHEDAH